MKKITAFSLAVIMALSITSCGKKELTPDERLDLMKSANSNAKSCYCEVADYLADLEAQDKLSEADEQTAVDKAVEYLKSKNISGTVGVSFDDPNNITSDPETYDFNITVQFRFAEDETVVGQYPKPASSLDTIPEWSVNAETSYEAEK